MQNEGRMNWEKVTRLWLLQTKSIGRKLSGSPFYHLLCNLSGTRPSKLCKYLILNFGTFLEEFCCGQFLMETFWWKSGGKYSVENCWWKIFGGKDSVETCWWKIFSRMGRDQLTGGVELTVGDELTGRGPDLEHSRQSQLCLYVGRKINGDIDQQVNIVQSASGRWTLDGRYFVSLFFTVTQSPSITKHYSLDLRDSRWLMFNQTKDFPCLHNCIWQ